MNTVITVDREDLTITYSDPLTLETIKILTFKSLEDLEKFIYNK